MGRTQQPDRHAGDDARLAARLGVADDAAAGGERGEDVRGEFEALGSRAGVSLGSVWCWGLGWGRTIVADVSDAVDKKAMRALVVVLS